VPLGAEHAGDEGDVGDDLAAGAGLPCEEDVDELGEGGEPVVGEQVVADEESVEEDVVRGSLDLIVRRYDPFYTQLWNQLTAVQQKTLSAVIEEGGVSLRSNRVVRSVGKGASTIQRALSALLGRDILREEEQGGAVRFRFEDPFFPPG
jgi:hypothetical protein